MKHKRFCKRCRDRNYLIECGCGCGKLLFRFNRVGGLRRFIFKHHPKGQNSYGYKNGRYKTTYGYILIHIPNHLYCDKGGYVREHRLVMEKDLGRYLLPTEEIHHINGIKDDNRIENLMLTDRKEHTSITFKKNMSNRSCEICGSKKTKVDKKGYQYWYRYTVDYICRNCYEKTQRIKYKTINTNNGY